LSGFPAGWAHGIPEPWRYDVTFWSRKRSTEQSALTVRPGSTLKRDVYKAATAGVTGVTAFGALAVTGAVAGTAAHDQAAKKQEVAPPAPATQVVSKRRKHRTVVRTRVVHAVSYAGAASSGSGGIVRSSSSGSTSHSSGGGSTATHSAPKPAPAPKPAAPKPAPSSGS
jgi:hypothetical protein